jgi:hypothetical protein
MKSTLSVLIIASYILCCLRLRARPWNYFHINVRHFCRQRGIFSKIELDQMIPVRWRLHQQYLDDEYVPEQFPVFLKPEWGQNSVGIERADNEHQFLVKSRRLKSGPVQYMVQQAAPESREFEIFTTFVGDRTVPDFVTVTETLNSTGRYPINGINNEDSRYSDITNMLTPSELTRISSHVREVGQFGQSRLSVRANSIQQLIDGDFHIIEINLFTPMPIHLMDDSYSVWHRLRSALVASWSLAKVTEAMGKLRDTPAIFTRMTLYGRKQQAMQQAALQQSSMAAPGAGQLQSGGKKCGSAVNTQLT